MPKLQQFNDLFTELEKSVAVLAKQEADLKASSILLESRNTFLNGEIAKLNSQKQTILNKVELANKELAAKTADIATAATDTETTIKQRQAELATKLSAIEVELETKQKELKAVSDDTVAKHRTLKELSTTQGQLETAIKGLEAKVNEQRSTLHAVQLEVEAARTNADETILNYEAEIEHSAKTLKTLKSDLDEAREDVEFLKEQVETYEARKAEAYKKHVEFIEYESKARKALAAAEESIIERENNLEVSIARAKRQHGILDKI